MNEKLKNAIVILLLLFFYPLGLILVFTWVRWPKRAKSIALIPIYLVVFAILLSLILLMISPKKTLQRAEEQRQQVIMLSPDQRRLMDGQIKADITMLQSALELYKSDYQKYPSTLSQLSPEYINEIKVNPFTKKAYLYKIAQDGTYSIITTLTNGSTYSQFAPF